METVRTYRDILKDELQRRLRHRAMYSLRSFARDLGMQASHLSEVLSAKKGLSYDVADKIVKRLKLSEEEQVWFLASVRSLHSRSTRIREMAAKEIQGMTDAEVGISSKNFDIFADPAHFTLLEILKMPIYKKTALENIASVLGAPTEKTSQMLNRLQEEKILSLNQQHEWEVHIHDEHRHVPARVQRDYHHALLQKAADTLEKNDMDECVYSSTQLSFSPSQREQAEAEIREFEKKFIEKYSLSGQENVYCLSLQFFPMLTTTVPSAEILRVEQD